MVAGMQTAHTTPGIGTTIVVAAGPLATLSLIMQMSGSSFLHGSLLAWAALGVALLWCPFLNTSASAIVLAPWRDGVDRTGGLFKALLRSPARAAVLMNLASWGVVALMCVVLFATGA
jgi:hypothetical protein